MDCPKVDAFPLSSLHEWPRFIGYGLHSAHAIILVFDISLESSFLFLKKLREEILQYQRENKHYFPLIIVANKFDLLSEEERQHRLRMPRANQRKYLPFMNANNLNFNLNFNVSDIPGPQEMTTCSKNTKSSFIKRSTRSDKNERIELVDRTSASTQSCPRAARVRLEENQFETSPIGKRSAGNSPANRKQGRRSMSILLPNAVSDQISNNHHLEPNFHMPLINANRTRTRTTSIDCAAFVRKVWRLPYIECSAKYN